MKKQDLVGMPVFYINPKSSSTIKDIRKLEDGKVIVYLNNGIIASADIVYLSHTQKEVIEVLDKDF